MSKEKVYEFAINYFNKSNDELGIKPEEIKPKKKETNIEKKDDEFGSIFDFGNNQKVEDKKEDIEQISLFGSIIA